MKTYCKPAQVDIESVDFNYCAVYKCLEGKWTRTDFRKLLRKHGLSDREWAQFQLTGNREKVNRALDSLTEEMTKRIRDRDLILPPIKMEQRVDGLTQKIRDICRESTEQQVMEYIAVEALQPLFRAKLLPFQYGSVPGKGQVSGKRRIERLLRRKFGGRVSVIKGDVKKAYPSVKVVCVMKLLRRDIGKNKVLLWFLGALMENYPDGHLCIGGYLPAWLFNYVMSYVLRYLMEQSYIRRGKRHKLVLAITCYADDFTVFGYFSELKKAMRKATKWCKTALGLNLKPAWQIYHVSSFDEEKKNRKERMKGSYKRTVGVDMMGYTVFRTYTIIRGRVLKRIRRQLLRAQNDLNKYGFIPVWRACKLTAYKGWLKYSNSRHFQKKYNASELLEHAEKSVSQRGRKEWIKYEQRMLRIAAG